MNKITVKLEDIKAQTQKALVNHGASERVAESVAEAVKVAEAETIKFVDCITWRVIAINSRAIGSMEVLCLKSKNHQIARYTLTQKMDLRSRLLLQDLKWLFAQPEKMVSACLQLRILIHVPQWDFLPLKLPKKVY